MPRKRSHRSDLLTIGLFAPVVIGSRLQMLALDAMKPTAAGRKEAIDMVAEKPLALMLGGLAVQAELARRSLQFWRAAMTATALPVAANPAAALAAIAMRPIGDKVQANARRLSRRAR